MTNKHPKGSSITSDQGDLKGASVGKATCMALGKRWGGIPMKLTAESEFAFGAQHDRTLQGIPKLE